MWNLKEPTFAGYNFKRFSMNYKNGEMNEKSWRKWNHSPNSSRHEESEIKKKERMMCAFIAIEIAYARITLGSALKQYLSYNK